MTEQEREQLSHFLKQLTEASVAAKDQEAEAMIRTATSGQPDASYLLVQRSLLLEQALKNAQAQIAGLQSQLQQRPASGGSFLNNDPWGQQSARQVPGAGNYSIPSINNFGQAAPVGNAFGGASSFLGNVATTAAGVVAGSFLFQGIENLLGHHGSPGGWGQPSWEQSGLGSENITEQTVINNYYGDNADASANDSSQDYYSTSADDDGDTFLPDGQDGDEDWV